MFFAFVVEQDARSLYEALYDNAISQFPSIVDWIAAAIYPIFLGLSCAIAAITVLKPFSSFQSFMVAVGVATFLGLSFLDAAFLLWQGDFQASTWIKNLLGNTLGGLANAFVIAAILAGSMRLVSNSNIRSHWRPYITAGIALAIGLVCSISIHLILRTALHPLPADIRLVSNMPVSTIMVSPPNSSIETEWPKFIPSTTEFDDLYLRVLGDVAVHWEKAQARPTFALSVYAVHGCSGISQAEEITNKQPIFAKEDFGTVKVQAETAMGFLFVDSQQSHMSIIKEDEPAKIVWLNQDSEDSNLSIQHFLSEEVEVQTRTYGHSSAMINGVLLKSDDDQIADAPVGAPVRFSLSVDNQEREITFSPSVIEDPSIPFACKALKADDSDAKVFHFDSQPLAGLLLQIERTGSSLGYPRTFDGQLSLFNLSGWLDVGGIDQSHTVNNIGRISIAKPNGRMEIEDDLLELNGDQQFSGYGDISLSYSKEGVLIIEGEYYAAWLGAKRLNKARFEAGPLEILVLLILPFGFLFVWPRKWIRKEWVANANVFQMILPNGG